ncbi:MAG: ABC transporter substrate-binding protein [Boseongicola sp. SB0673_bin_14]|nr:ABC transporter substrate-binding protein [Boseongicola sp. SB0667_bin_21]MYI69949.1 ABC transporter substrate-binding protein [Boseongicola sp. SB0673_bin_14]
MERRKFLKTGVLAAMATTACFAQASLASAQGSPDILTIASPAGFPDLDPATSFSNDGAVLANAYETLTRYVPDMSGGSGTVEPVLAESWSSSDDGLTWTFRLRGGVSFSDGAEFNAASVKASIERTQAIGGGAAFIWSPVEAIETPDDMTVVMKLAWPQPMDVTASAGFAAWIMSPNAVDKDNAWFNAGNSAGTGPYVISRYEPGQRLIMERNKGYWGGDAGGFENIVFEIIEDSVLAQSMLESGQADWATNLPFENIAGLEARPGVTAHVNPSFQNLFGLLNVRRPPLDDVRVRRALALAFPYDDVIAAGTEGLGSRSMGIIPPGIWGHDTDAPVPSTDLAAAKALLDEAAVSDVALTMTYGTGDALQQLAGELWRANLSALGIDLVLQPMAWEAQWELAKANPETAQDIFVMYWWPTYVTPYDFLFSLFNSEDEPFFNLGYYSNPEFDAVLDEANVLSNSDRAASEERFRQANRVVVEDAAAVFMLDMPNVHFTRSDIEGYVDNPAYGHVVFANELRRN